MKTFIDLHVVLPIHILAAPKDWSREKTMRVPEAA